MEIEFRVWDTKSNTMLDWSCINQTAFNSFNILYEYNYYKTNYEKDENLRHERLFLSSFLYLIFHNPQFILMQFTTAFDKNKKKAFDSDIIKFDDKTGLIYWHKEYYGFFVKFINDSDEIESIPLSEIGSFEIIGNRWQNENLIKDLL